MTAFTAIARRLAPVLFAAVACAAQAADKPFEPYSGQPGKDVVWVPTSQAMVDRMLDIAKLGAGDVHFDLGSGDGRTVITAAKRGARALGIAYNPDMVELTLTQEFQMLGGSLKTAEKSVPLRSGRVRGDVVNFNVGGVDYAGRINGNTMSGTIGGAGGGTWTATRGGKPAAK